MLFDMGEEPRKAFFRRSVHLVHRHGEGDVEIGLGGTLDDLGQSQHWGPFLP
ncbi:hypothetical protein STIAU_2336 [Stigmatella aurantiaca DW4/3-1]|uniref:Uncharacterized protein n=1 Tax=Stigmatella aurantiaca (strain DW4/3-1) TaxID=378806 RepID=Q08WI3_STIAD|nr:hypothetical protein STIAU_2336 [Stigmatella aurantiaca DW4/3-1]